MKYSAPEFGESLKLTKKEKREMKEAFKRFENSPAFKKKYAQGEAILRGLKNSPDPATRAKYAALSKS